MSLRQCCFLSMDSLEGFVSDDQLAIPALNERGWEVKTVSWRDSSADWNDFEVTVIRTTWDYQRYPADFISVLRDIEGSASHLENSLKTVKWNLDKRYLQDLATRGIPILPTLWDTIYSETELHVWFEKLKTQEIIVKPTISATAEHTYRLAAYDPSLQPIFERQAFMVQPFLSAIVDEGEYSLFYFNGEFSHAILKKPKPSDFRVQEEHGGIISPVAADMSLLDAGSAAMACVDPVPLYGRVDLVRDSTGQWLIMELELIEPSLYFRTDARSPHRFAKALTQRVENKRR
jgi:hypothetical protein